MVTGRQIRAGRALIKWSSAELAEAALLGRMTIVKAESFDDLPKITKANLRAIITTLEAQGVVFLEENGVRYVPKA